MTQAQLDRVAAEAARCPACRAVVATGSHALVQVGGNLCDCPNVGVPTTGQLRAAGWEPVESYLWAPTFRRTLPNGTEQRVTLSIADYATRALRATLYEAGTIREVPLATLAN